MRTVSKQTPETHACVGEQNRFPPFCGDFSPYVSNPVELVTLGGD